MKKKLVGITTALVLFGITGMAQATLTTIGKASYMGSEYKLIYDDDSTGYGGGGLVWLDYTHSVDTWENHVGWVSGLGSYLTVTLNPGYTTDIDWTTGWRLPDTVDGAVVHGYEGDPDNDGVYGYTGGYNLANSEIGHLFYTELGNLGYQNTDGSYPQFGWGQAHTGNFDNLATFKYWSGTEYADYPLYAWHFDMHYGSQYRVLKDDDSLGLAVHSGHVAAADLIPDTLLGDINSDGKIDLKEAIYALQVVSGSRPSEQIDSSILGAWWRGSTSTDVGKIFVLVFFSNGTYIHVQNGDDVNANWNGYEFGNYSYNVETKVFSPTPLVDMNEEVGLSHLGGQMTIAVEGNTITINVVNEGVVTFYRVK